VYKLSFDPIADITPIVAALARAVRRRVHPLGSCENAAGTGGARQAGAGQLAYASSGNGSHVPVATAYLLYTAKIKITHVPYKGTGPALNDTIAEAFR